MSDQLNQNSPSGGNDSFIKKIKKAMRTALDRVKGTTKFFDYNKILSSGKNSGTMRDLRNAFGHIKPQKALLILVVCVFGIYLLTGIYIVNPGEQAVIRRFGVLQGQPVSEGLHYRLPFPIDEVQKVNVSEVRRADIGMSLPEHVHQPNEEPTAIQLLTGDENIITSQASVHYQINDAAKYLYNVNGNGEQLVRYSVEAALVQLMASTAVDDILSTEKVEAQNSILQLAQDALNGYDAGIQITAFNIQAIVPPDNVSAAFLDVTTAKEEKETAINEANGYYNSLIPKARAEANKLISDAEAYKQEQLSRATGDTEKFLAMLTEYQKNSAIYTEDTTKYRLLLETLEKILPTAKLYIVDSADGNVDVRLFDSSISGGVNIAPGNE
ncbi:FtsH protease activity modulator HflK [Anaerotignum sp.]|nr:FtsH protease activity modulator HflK [Anaerotignum sp.]